MQVASGSERIAHSVSSLKDDISETAEVVLITAGASEPNNHEITVSGSKATPFS